MTATEQSGLEEKAQAERVIATLPKLPEIDSFNVRLDNDWSGDPSLYVTFQIRPGADYNLDFYKRFGEFRMSVINAVFGPDMTRFPYISFEEAA